VARVDEELEAATAGVGGVATVDEIGQVGLGGVVSPPPRKRISTNWASSSPGRVWQTTLDCKTCKPAGSSVPLFGVERGTDEIIVLAVSSREQSPGCQARKDQVLHSYAMEIRVEGPLQLLTPLH
jgi:hypothetical protein